MTTDVPHSTSVRPAGYPVQTAHSSHKSTQLASSRLLLWVTLAFVVVFVAWTALFSIDQVVHSQGQVVASSSTQVVQVADGGVIVALKVEEGDKVQKGQVLAMLEKERAQAAYSETQGKVMALGMTVKRLRAEIADTPLTMDEQVARNYPDLVATQMNLYRQRRQALEGQLDALGANVKLAEKELEMNQPLEARGDVSQADILRLRRSLNEAKVQLFTIKSRYLQDASAELNKAQEDLNSQEQAMVDRRQILGHTDVLAPATGVVKSIRVTTRGGVLRQGDELMQILPTESSLVIEARVKPVDMANITVGLPVKVKLDAYDYAIFGTMNGQVAYVSADTLTEDTRAGAVSFYRVKVTISEADFKGAAAKAIEVRPGMTATVDIQTGRRTILSYLTKPLTKTFAESFGER